MIDEKVLIDRLEEEKAEANCQYHKFLDDSDSGRVDAYEIAIEIVKDLAEEHNNGFCGNNMESKEIIEKMRKDDRLLKESAVMKSVQKAIIEMGYEPFGEKQERIYKAIESTEEHNNGWIPCEVELPPQPEENPFFEGKPLEIYMVSEKGVPYTCRAFWNGKCFTDGFGKLDVVAWQPLPPAWKGE